MPAGWVTNPQGPSQQGCCLGGQLPAPVLAAGEGDVGGSRPLPPGAVVALGHQPAESEVAFFLLSLASAALGSPSESPCQSVCMCAHVCVQNPERGPAEELAHSRCFTSGTLRGRPVLPTVLLSRLLVCPLLTAAQVHGRTRLPARPCSALTLTIRVCRTACPVVGLSRFTAAHRGAGCQPHEGSPRRPRALPPPPQTAADWPPFVCGPRPRPAHQRSSHTCRDCWRLLGAVEGFMPQMWEPSPGHSLRHMRCHCN